MLKQQKTPEEVEAKRKKQEELRKALEDQIMQREHAREQKKQQEKAFFEQQQASLKVQEEQEKARKERAVQKQTVFRGDLEKQAEQERTRRTEVKVARTLGPTGRPVAPNVELRETAQLTTLGVSMRYVPVLKDPSKGSQAGTSASH